MSYVTIPTLIHLFDGGKRFYFFIRGLFFITCTFPGRRCFHTFIEGDGELCVARRKNADNLKAHTERVRRLLSSFAPDKPVLHLTNSNAGP